MNYRLEGLVSRQLDPEADYVQVHKNDPSTSSDLNILDVDPFKCPEQGLVVSDDRRFQGSRYQHPVVDEELFILQSAVLLVEVGVAHASQGEFEKESICPGGKGGCYFESAYVSYRGANIRDSLIQDRLQSQWRAFRVN